MVRVLCGIALCASAAGLSHAATFELGEATIADMQKAMNEGGVSSVEITALYLNRILVYDQSRSGFNAVAQINPGIFDEAAAADRQRASGGKTGTLQGVPILVKDSYDVAGLASAAGARPLKRNIAKKDAPVIAALRDAGGIILGKTNMWPFAYGISYDPDSRYAWGRTKNPYTREDDFGGSSTGSAAAAAANFCGFAMGGDTGSSIRLPSARTALVGGRPSFALLPGSGTFPDQVAFDVIGPMTRTAADNAIVMDAVAVDDPNPLDTNFFPLTSKVRPKTYTSRLSKDALRGKVVGLPKPYIGRDPDAKPLDPAIQPIWNRAVARLKSLGARVKEIDWPFYHNFSRDTPSGKASDYHSVGLSDEQFSLQWKWVGAYYFNQHIKSYHFPPVRSVLDLPSPDEQQDPQHQDTIGEFKDIVREGRARPFAAYDFDSYFAAYRRWAKRDVQAVMAAAGVDLLAFPVAGGDTEENFEDFEFLNGLNEGSFLGLPQYSVPMGYGATGRPQGMMIMARTYYTEAEILGYAYAFEQGTKFRRAPSTTPPLPGETITYAPSSPASRPEIDPPKVSIAPGIRHAGRGNYRIIGTARDATGLESVTIFLNGRRVTVTKAASWTARIPAKRFGRLTRNYDGRPFVLVLAKDIYGNASARAVWLRVTAG